MSSIDEIAQRLESLASTLTDETPFISGICSLTQSMSVLVYGKGTVGGRMDFSSDVSTEALRRLAETCDPATFGLNQQDVLDESYRKAGKLDNEHFGVTLDPGTCGIIDTIYTDFLEERLETRSIRAERYKLNVYGQQSFFKPHKDTPFANSMFGSLVIVYPTVHEGGALVLRYRGREWTVDSADLLAGSSQPSVAYICFYSDVEHEVLPVTSGYRLTVTYNLFFDKAPRGRNPKFECPSPLSTQDFSTFRNALKKFISDESFLPNGGVLGFGLRHEYPLSLHSQPLEEYLDYLKGTDAVIKEACEALDIDICPRVIYQEGIICDHVADLDVEGCMESTAADSLVDGHDGVCLRSHWVDGMEIHWVTQPNATNIVRASYVAMGNEVCLDHTYGFICLIAEIPPWKDRHPGDDSSRILDCGESCS